MATVSDQPWRVHWPLILPWLVFQGILIAYAIVSSGLGLPFHVTVSFSFSCSLSPFHFHDSVPPGALLEDQLPLFSSMQHPSSSHGPVDAVGMHATELRTALCVARAARVFADAGAPVCQHQGRQHPAVGGGTRRLHHAWIHSFREQIRVRLLALLLLTVVVLVLYGVGWNSCASLRLAWLGYAYWVGTYVCIKRLPNCTRAIVVSYSA